MRASTFRRDHDPKRSPNWFPTSKIRNHSIPRYRFAALFLPKKIVPFSINAAAFQTRDYVVSLSKIVKWLAKMEPPVSRFKELRRDNL